MQTIDRTSQTCCRIGTVSVLTNGGSHAVVNVLVSRERPHGYNLLIGIDAIRTLGGITFTPPRDMKLGGGKEACAALCVDELDFNASLDHNERIWTAMWKWTLNKHQPYSATKLQNIRYLRTSGESTRGNCKCTSRTFG